MLFENEPSLVQVMRMFSARHDELRSYLSWRRKTRFIRHYGGPLLALCLLAVCIQLLWRVPRQHGSKPTTNEKKEMDVILSQKSRLP